MSGNSKRVLLDLNYPAFQEELFELDVTELKKAFKSFKKLNQLSWQQLFSDNGLKWEEVVGMPGNFTIRLSKSYRAIVLRDGQMMRFISLHLDHDGAYGKK